MVLQLKSCARHLGIYTIMKQSMNTTSQSNFKTVYKFPYVTGAGLINRLKLYQTILSTVTVPLSGLLNQLNILPYDDVLFTVALSSAGLIPLYGFGYFTNKLVGIVYLDSKKNLAKIAYLDFWGRRKDVEISIQDIMPLSETPRSLTDPLYIKVRQYSSSNTMKLCSNYGILDKDGYNKIFLQYESVYLNFIETSYKTQN